MRWIYLFFFLLILLVPEVIIRDYGVIREEHLESLSILLVGIMASTVFLWREKQLSQHMADKRRYQQEVSDVSKDLVNSYSYIGEINRQLEILKNIALGLPEGDEFTEEKRKEVFDAILEAVLVFSRTESFVLRFVHCEDGRIEDEMGMGKPVFSEKTADLLGHDRKTFRIGEHSVVRTAKPLDGYAAFILLDRTQVSDEDAEFLQAVASQALFLFVWGKRAQRDV